MTIREDPPAQPPDGRHQSERVWADRLAGAMAEPGVWYRLEHDWDPSTLSRLKRAAAVAAGLPDPRETRAARHDPPPKLPPGRWEFKSRRVEFNLRSVIWARLVPDEEAE